MHLVCTLLILCHGEKEKGSTREVIFAFLLLGCGFFAYSWKLPTYSGAFLLTVDNFSFLTYSWSFFTYGFSFFTYSWSFFAYSGKVCLIRALRDCKQSNLTVSKKTPTWGTGGILFREYCFGEENSLSSAANSVSSARNSVSSRLHTNNRPKGTH